MPDPMGRSKETNEAHEKAIAALVAGPKATATPITVIATLDANIRKPLAYYGGGM